ncbi:MAG: type II toxin-antitoxin system RelE/ParE family toxin [Thermoguttaceae bacterium]|jgi:hypothetical protein
MTPAAVYHDEAEAELNEAADRYESLQQRLGERFLDAVDVAISEICRSPEGFGFLRADIRCHKVRRFPYGILYRVQPDCVFILAVMHLARKSDYWEHRLDG